VVALYRGVCPIAFVGEEHRGKRVCAAPPEGGTHRQTSVRTRAYTFMVRPQHDDILPHTSTNL